MLRFNAEHPKLTLRKDKMIQPNELKLNLQMQVGNGTISTTTKVWEVLLASHNGDLQTVKALVNECPGLIYAQYNYAPPIHFAVREGHADLVKYLLDNGAHDPDYKFYPFQESLQTVANDRGYVEIENMLNEYAADISRHKYKGDNGEIYYYRTELQQAFEKAVVKNDLDKAEEILKEHPEFALDETYCWSEGILLFPAKRNNREMIDLLMSYGAKIPDILKWTQFYYFERLDGATYIMQKGMNPNTMSWQYVTILHDMAQKGFLDKAGLLIKHGADLNVIDEAYQSTPLGLAAGWGQIEMVKYLLQQGADVNKSGASWSTPLAWAKKKEHVEVENILREAGAA
ncbi:MAG TPA: ankyrin repeat domain-containing protein [Parafilimonas sp.]|nr:ankyrin repeat domain-containing protein [Parafilimonas sp.]